MVKQDTNNIFNKLIIIVGVIFVLLIGFAFATGSSINLGSVTGQQQKKISCDITYTFTNINPLSSNQITNVACQTSTSGCGFGLSVVGNPLGILTTNGQIILTDGNTQASKSFNTNLFTQSTTTTLSKCFPASDTSLDIRIVDDKGNLIMEKQQNV